MRPKQDLFWTDTCIGSNKWSPWLSGLTWLCSSLDQLHLHWELKTSAYTERPNVGVTSGWNPSWVPELKGKPILCYPSALYGGFSFGPSTKMGEQPQDEDGHHLGRPLANKLTGITDRWNSSWWLSNQLSDSWACPDTVAKAGTNLQTCWTRIWLLVRAKDVCVVKNRLYQLCKWFTWPAGFLLEQCRVWGIYTLLLSLYSPQSSGLVSNKGPTSHQLKGSNTASCRPFPLGVCMKHLYKSRHIAFPPGKSSSTLQVSWSSVDDAWENISERAEGLRGVVLLSLKGQQQGLCWNFLQNLHHSQEGWTSYKEVRHGFFKR